MSWPVVGVQHQPPRVDILDLVPCDTSPVCSGVLAADQTFRVIRWALKAGRREPQVCVFAGRSLQTYRAHATWQWQCIVCTAEAEGIPGSFDVLLRRQISLVYCEDGKRYAALHQAGERARL